MRRNTLPVLGPILVLACLAQPGCAPSRPTTYFERLPSSEGLAEARLPDGSVYRGALADGLFHGQGTLTYADGTRYQGTFAAGLANGTGTLHGLHGYRYEGEFADGAFQGTGTLTTRGGAQYEGEFRHGKMDGQGDFLSPGGHRYVGEFKDDEPSGYGTITYASGDRYEGPWQSWEPAGEGVYTDTDGWVYRGPFADGEPMGTFSVTYPDGARYDGEMSGWAFEGQGVYLDEDGNRYEGEFAEDSFEGEGRIVSAAGDVYEGATENWRPHGEGRMVRASGEVYEGHFRRGRYSGAGTVTRADGSLYQGQFRAGAYHGTGTLRWTSADGEQQLQGPFVKGLYVGLERNRFLAEGIAAADAEQLLFDQPRRLADALAQLGDQRPGHSDLFLLTFASHGQQDVFRSEAALARDRMLPRFVEPDHSVSLVNHPATVRQQPLATATNLKAALRAIGRKMDPAEDVLFLFLTSHGSKDHALSVNLPGAEFENLRADALSAMLDDAGIRWRVVVVSACYSGGFIPALRNEQTMVMTSARADRTSFGCSDDADLTYFGRAYFEQALPAAPDFESAFFRARKLIAEREQDNGYEASEPQIHIGRLIEDKLARLPALLAQTTDKD